MPITCPLAARRITQDEFAVIDYRVMRHAFDSQNELGRLCDGGHISQRPRRPPSESGTGPVHTEVPVTVSHRDFSKTYRLDLVVGEASVHELKTKVRLATDHDAQLLNYLFLYGAQHGKLINFRPAKV